VKKEQTVNPSTLNRIQQSVFTGKARWRSFHQLLSEKQFKRGLPVQDVTPSAALTNCQVRNCLGFAERRMADLLNLTHVVLALDVGGLERNVVNQVQQARKLGQRVSVVCLEGPGALAPKAEAFGARVICLNKRPGLQPGLIRRMRAALLELRPDVVHTHHITPLLYTGLAALAAPVPLLVHTEHGRSDYGRLKTKWAGRLASRFVKRFYCLTKDMAEWVTGHQVVHRSKVRVIHNGIDTSCFTQPGDAVGVRRSLGIADGVPVIGTVGRLNEIKRHDLLIRAFALVRKQFTGAHLLLVGDGPLRSNLSQQADALGLSQYVHFVGYQAATAPYFHAMQVFALTSRSEGMPQALLEACVAGVPVVASRVGGVPEVIENGRTGFLFDPGDEAGLSNSLVQLLTKPALGRKLAREAHARVMATYHIGRMSAEYHRDFLDLLHPDRPRTAWANEP
jgi:glycosyltransferase involved in cell wall biosynthesis